MFEYKGVIFVVYSNREYPHKFKLYSSLLLYYFSFWIEIGGVVFVVRGKNTGGIVFVLRGKNTGRGVVLVAREKNTGVYY